MVVACNDPYLRIFSFKENKVVKSIKSYYGNPLCIDMNYDKNLMVVGFEDDSFSIIGTRTNF